MKFIPRSSWHYSALVATVAVAAVTMFQQSSPHAQGTASWPQAGGPNRNFIITNGPRLADSWPEGGPRKIWNRPLGAGHSAIVVEDGRAYTLYRPVTLGQPRSWQAEEVVIAMDAATGKTLWEHKYPSKLEDISQGSGPHSTPLVVGDRLFAAGTNKQFFAFDKRTGKVLWSYDLVKDLGAPVLLVRPEVKAGYGCSPIAYKENVICFVGGPGQAVVSFKQSDGSIAWKSGDFLTSDAPPMLITFAGQQQLVTFAGAAVYGMDPDTGRVLWSHIHDPGNDFNFSPPIWGPDNILFVSSAYKMGSRAIRLKQEGTRTLTEELWFAERLKFQFLNAIRLGDFVYGTSGSLNSGIVTAINVNTGQVAWQHRGGSQQATLVYADNKAIMLSADGELAIAKFAPEAITVLAQAKVFDTVSWTVPSLVGTTLYARDREYVAALDLGAGAK